MTIDELYFYSALFEEVEGNPHSNPNPQEEQIAPNIDILSLYQETMEEYSDLRGSVFTAPQEPPTKSHDATAPKKTRSRGWNASAAAKARWQRHRERKTAEKKANYSAAAFRRWNTRRERSHVTQQK